MDQLTLRSTLLELFKEPYTAEKFVEWLKYYESIPDSASSCMRKATVEKIVNCDNMHTLVHYLHYILLDEGITITDEMHIKKFADLLARINSASERFLRAYLKQVNDVYNLRNRALDSQIHLQKLLEKIINS
ncbi:hypothetical protein HGH92_26540 [Chitinophaga varians]|uniref:Uncharacterized protein n=1 Tax=Chitinophaga varians TaxID=2202339 RepID=A0A847S874_9BACT|nr:hypothetical protein [Chitinophaga varians]NLR67891.1 hypothetical protein [Chitinophaga varians]